MKDKWEKGDPVNLSDLLKITPVANEIIRLSDELNMKCSDVMWIVTEIIKDCETCSVSDSVSAQVDFELESDDDAEPYDEDWDREYDDKEDTHYRVYLKINSKGKFPEVSFKAGINEQDDLKGFLSMVIELMGKMDM
ncbi:MAG: hypothetical protein ACM3PP_04220 [Candidatus Saccharibacteria bacterium]